MKIVLRIQTQTHRQTHRQTYGQSDFLSLLLELKNKQTCSGPDFKPMEYTLHTIEGRPAASNLRESELA